MSQQRSNEIVDQVANPRVTLRVKPNGSIRVTGTVDFVDLDGNVIEEKTDFSLCRCGHSKNMPFCDSSHRAAGFTAPEYCPSEPVSETE